MRRLNICVFGSGYVGLVSGACFAEIGHNVICCDTDEDKISLLNSGGSPIYEPGLNEIISRNFKQGNLSFCNIENVNLQEIDLVVIAVGTPNNQDGSTNLTYVTTAVELINQQKHKDLTVMVKSTVPLGTCKRIYDILNSDSSDVIDVVSNPEFLREGSAVGDFLNPERVVLGFFSDGTKNKLQNLYAGLSQDIPVIYTDCATSELIKYASNAFLSAKVAFINEIAHICEKIGADIHKVSLGMGLDSRIGNKFLNPGPGFGGSCFPKDIQALKILTDSLGSNNKLIAAIEDSNHSWKRAISHSIAQYAHSKKIRSICFWGVTYKAGTDDVRSSSVIDITKYLLQEGFKITCCDPKGLNNLKKLFGTKLTYIDDLYKTSARDSLIVVATEWEKFKNVDYQRLAASGKTTIFDLRNIVDTDAAKKAGFKVHKLGEKIYE